MKLKLIQEEKLGANVTSLTLDNIFDTTYEDYVVTAHDGLGNVPNNYLRFLNSSGTEISSSVHAQHQIYGTSSAENYSQQSTGNIFNDGSYLLNSAERVRGIKLVQYNTSTYYNKGILSVYGIEY